MCKYYYLCLSSTPGCKKKPKILLTLRYPAAHQRTNFSPYPPSGSVGKESACSAGVKEKVAQSCPTLCNPMNCTVHGILQAGILEWAAFPFSRGLPNPGIEPGSPALQVDSLPAEPLEKPKNTGVGSLSLLQECRRPRFNPCVRKIPLRGKWQPTLVFLPGKYLGQRDLVSYSPWSPQRVRHDLSTKPLPPFILI